jgi:hypothetical protein
MRSFLRLLVITTSLLVCSPVSAAFDGSQLLIPADSKLSVELLSPITTSTSKKGDKFSCRVLTPAEYAGAIVEGHIRNLKRSGKANKDSKIDLAFENITLSDGRTGDLSAMIIEVFDVAHVSDQGRADNEGTVSSKPRTLKMSVKRAAAGALIGALVGGVIAGGQGAAIGAAIGASVGVTTSIASRGPDLEFPTGTQFTIQVNGPRKRTTQPK